MNDDDYWNDMSQPSYTRELYDLIKNYGKYKEYSRKDLEMPYYNSYNNTKGDEVANAVLEAYATGVEFETLIRKNGTVRQYWSQIQSEKVGKEKARERETARLVKLAAARAAKEAAKKEVMAKLSKEELEAFGLIRKGKR